MRRIALSTFLSTSAVAILYGAVLITASGTTDMPMLPYEINSLIIASLAVAVILSGVWALLEHRLAAPKGLDGYAAGYADGLARTPANGKVMPLGVRQS